MYFKIVLITCFELIVIKGCKRIFINPSGAEKQKILYKKKWSFYAPAFIYFYSFLTIILLFIFYIVQCKHVIDHPQFYFL